MMSLRFGFGKFWVFFLASAFAFLGSGYPKDFAFAQESKVLGIEWELTNPFRLFKKPELLDTHRRLYEAMERDDKSTPILTSERLLGAQNPRGWAEAMIDETCWSRKSGTYSNCGSVADYIQPKSHEIWLSVSHIKDVSLRCSWVLKSLPTRRSKKVKKLAETTEACDQKVSFKIPYPRGGEVVVELSDGRIVSKIIRVKDIFVVGMGDSFASGEGNPDVPVRLSADRYAVYGANGKNKSAQDYFANRGYPTRIGDWKQVGDAAFMKKRALWLSQSCHRSLYSHQLRAALQLAVTNPQRAVTFVSYACAGAEITHGLFLRFKGNEWSPTPPKRSQISNVAQVQCGDRPAVETQYSTAFGLDGKLEVLRDLPLLRCQRHRARKIDLLMLSIGGNDVRFSSLVANVVVKDIHNLRLIGGWMGHILSASDAKRLIGSLRLRYKALNRALHNVLHIPWKQADRILLTGYPNMSFRGEGQSICSDGSLGMNVAPLFSLSSKQAREAERFANTLNDEMRRVARRYKWTFVDEHRPAFLPHGLCASNPDAPDQIAENLELPFWQKDQWVPFNPSEYKPYVSRKRWFRTPNDAYLTGHLHLSGPVIRNIFKIKGFNRLQVLIAGTYSGAFHPTAEGQAVIADSLAKAADRVLKKYRQ